jgi:hypothetical protein
VYAPKEGSDNGLTITLIFTGIVLACGANFLKAFRARSNYMRENTENFNKEIQNLRIEGHMVKKSYEDGKVRLITLRKEVAEKQKELDWHLQNVKLKRE